MSLRNHVVAVRALAAGVLIWIAVQVGQGLWLGEWRYALSGVVGGLLWLALVVVLPLRSNIALACPHCGEPVPTDVCTGRGMIAVLVLLAALVVGKEAYTWPMALPSLPQEEVSVTVQRNAYPLVENYAAFPQTQMEHYVLKPGTPEAEEVAEILSDYTYRRCWKTLRGDTAVSGLGEVQCYLSGTEFDLSLLGSRYAFINGAVYQIGLAGDGAGAELAARIAQALE